jgi:hypothetical protein
MLYVSNKITKKIISIIISGILFFPCVNFASEHESTQQKKQTKYDVAKKLIKGAIEGYATYLGGSVAHEFGHWSAGKIIYSRGGLQCNGFSVIHLNGTGITYHYRNRTTKPIIENILYKEYVNKDHTFEPPLVRPEKQHPLVIAAGPLLGIGYSLLAQKAALQSNMFVRALGAQLSLILNIKQLSPFHTDNDGSQILQCFNINCTSATGEMACRLAAASAALMLGVWNIKAFLPTAAT